MLVLLLAARMEHARHITAVVDGLHESLYINHRPKGLHPARLTGHANALRRYLGAGHQVDWAVGGGAISDVTATVNPCLVDETLRRRPLLAG